MFSQNLLLRENDRWIVKASFSSNNQWGIIKLPLPLSKLYIIVRANLPGNLAAVYLLTILLISISKFEAIFLALCNSPIITLCLYLTWIFDVQSTGSFLILSYTWVVILLFLRITSVSRNMAEFNSKVSFLFWWYEFNAWWNQSVSFCFLLTYVSSTWRSCNLCIKVPFPEI